MHIKAEDIAFWILILAALAVILWLLHGSPTLENALISIGIFLLSSELLLWKKYFEVDKNVAVSFMRMKHDLITIKGDVESIKNNVEKIDVKADGIENLLKRKRR